MEKTELLIGRLMLISVLISFVIVLIGGALYLYSHGGDIIQYNSFHAPVGTYNSIGDIISYGFSSSLGFIQLGLLVLILIQIIRVALTVFYFIKLREIFFSMISLFILAVLGYSLFWH